jgi:hypothetical protein
VISGYEQKKGDIKTAQVKNKKERENAFKIL